MHMILIEYISVINFIIIKKKNGILQIFLHSFAYIAGYCGDFDFCHLPYEQLQRKLYSPF